MFSSTGRVSRAVRLSAATLIAATTMASVPSPELAAATSEDPAASLAVTSCPAGSDPILPVSSRLDADGWIHMDYDIGGIRGYRELPPVGFDPVQASDEVLARHHIAARPQAAGDQGLGEAQASLSGRVRTKSVCRLPFAAGTWRKSYNWAGDEVRAQSAYQYTGVQANFIQQPYNSGCEATGISALSQWVGLGGDGDTVPLVQAGTNVWHFAPVYSAWAEVIIPGVSNTGQIGLNVPVAQNDNMFAYVTVGMQGIQRQAWLEVMNMTKGIADYLVVDVTPTGAFSGVSAEWIDERPTMIGPYGGLTSLMKFSKTTWSNMKSRHSNTGSWYGAYSEATEWWIRMWSLDSKYKMAQTSGTYSDSHMYDYWYDCGHGA